MAISLSFSNDQTQKPDIYISRPDMDKYTLTIRTDGDEELEITQLRIQFPTGIFDVSDIQGILAEAPGMQSSSAGPYIILSGKTDLSAKAPVVIKMSGVKTSRTAAANADLSVHVADEVPQIKIFLLKYEPGAKDLADALLPPRLLPAAQVYRTPSGKTRIENVLNLLLTNRDKDKPLVTESWKGQTPRVIVSFVYGNDIGSLTPDDSKVSDPYSAWNITFSVEATYKDGKKTFEWTAANPDGGSGETNPLWILQPVPENPGVLGPQGGANGSFKIAGLSTNAPSGATQMYLQFSNFPGYNDGYFTVGFSKIEPSPAIIYFDADPTYLDGLNDSVSLRWRTFAVDKVNLRYDQTILSSSKGEIDVGTDSAASATVPIGKNTVFTLEAYDKIDDPVPQHSFEQTVFVPPVRIESFTGTAEKYAVGQSARLEWRISSAVSAKIEASAGPGFSISPEQLTEGTMEVFPQGPTLYTLVASGQDGPAKEQVELFFLTEGWKKQDSGIDFRTIGGPLLFSLNDALWLLSGNGNNAIFKSEDGTVWYQAGSAPFSPRNWAGGTSYQGKLWILGGVQASENSRLNDVWSSENGTDWNQVNANASWSARSNFGCVGFNQKLWILGGLDINLNRLKDVWNSEDGVHWTKVTDSPGWSARYGFGLTVFNGRIWLVGGSDGSDIPSGEVWNSSDGAAWHRQAPCPYACENPVFIEYNSCLYLFGGTQDNLTALANFYKYDPSGQWMLIGGPDWKVFNMGYALFKKALWMTGGSSSKGSNKAVWTFFQAD